MIGHQLICLRLLERGKSARGIQIVRFRDLRTEFGDPPLHAGSVSASTVAALSFAGISFGVSLGAHSPNQSEA